MSKDDDDDETAPLGFLDRLLDEERHSNLHLGDVRFWKHLEHINTSLIYRTKSLEYRTMKLMFCEVMLYVSFLAVFTAFLVLQRSGSLYESRRHQLDYWAGCTRVGDGKTCTIDQVTSPESLMEWMAYDFAPKAFTEQELYPPIGSAVSILRLQSGVVPWTPRYVGDRRASVLVGAVRIRQLRVQYNLDCEVIADFKSIHPDCFPKYSPGVESKLAWHPVWAPDHIKKHYKWYPANETEQGDLVGYHGTYPGNGFVLDLPLNLTGAQARMKELEEWSWLDFRTRAVIIELNTLTPNVNIFVNTKLLFEFPATGGIYIKQEVTSFRSFMMSLALVATDDAGGTFTLLILTTALFIMMSLYTLFLLVKNGPLFFTYFWSVVDLIILLLYVILIGMTFNRISACEREPNLQPEVLADPEMFFPIGKFTGDLELSNSIMALLGLLVWFKVLKYFSLSGIFAGYVRVVERCVVNLVLFASLLFLVLFGFAVALHIGYGSDENLFGSIWGSLIAVIVAPSGGVNWEPVFEGPELLGPVLIFLYIIVVLLLLINTFMAIVVDTYSVCLYELNEGRADRPNPMLIFLWTYINALRCVKLVGKESEEDRGGAQEQEIQLNALPEAIQVRFVEQRRKMLALVASVQAKLDEEERKRNNPELYNTTMSGDDDDDIHPPTPRILSPQAPDEDLQHMVVKRVQLQRMLEDDPVMREICNADKAVDVIRRFRVDALGGADPYEAVARLQASIAEKLQELEDRGMDLSFDEMETLKTVSSELHAALTESQKEWRSELLSVLQMASLLSKALIDLTNQLAKVQTNHNDLATRASPN